MRNHLHRLALSPVRMLACTFEPDVVMQLSEHFRCIGNFKTADTRRMSPNNFVYLYINTGVSRAKTMIYGRVLSIDTLTSVLPLLCDKIAKLSYKIM